MLLKAASRSKIMRVWKRGGSTAKDYAYQFLCPKGAGHTQRKVIDNTLPQALEYVWLDYKPQR